MPQGAGSWKEKEPLSASKLNANDALNIRELRVGPGLTLVRNAYGQATITLSDQGNPIHIVRVHVTTLPASATPMVAGVTPWDGTNPTGPELFAKLLTNITSLPSSSSPEHDFLICRPFGGTDQTDPNGAPVVWQEMGASPATLLFGVLASAWSPGTNNVTLKPCTGYNNTTLLTDSHGSPLPQVLAYISFPYNSICPALQKQSSGDGPYAYKTEGSISYLVSPNQWPAPTDTYDVIVNRGTPTAPNDMADYPLGHP